MSATRRAFEPMPPKACRRLRRVLWQAVWLLFYRPSPVLLHGWRRFLLCCFGATIGRGAHPYPSARIWAPWALEMGEDSCLAGGVDCYSVGAIVLGARAIVSQRAFLCTASRDYNHPEFRTMVAPIRIGEDAWVGAEAYIGPGVSLGTGAIAGARAVVTHDVAAWCVVAGNPARVIATRAPRG